VHPFYVVVGVKGAAKVAVGDELMLGGYGRGKMNHVQLDWVQGGGGDCLVRHMSGRSSRQRPGR
jgi:hypothetical protein